MDGAAIGERIKKAREGRRWSQRMLAYRSEVSHAHISHLEAGSVPRPGVAMLKKLCGALGLTLEELLGDLVSVEPEAADEVAAELEDIRVDLQILRELSPSAILSLRDIVLALREKAERDTQAQESHRRRTPGHSE